MNKKIMKIPSGRGRPRKFDQTAALDTAVQQFWRHGYEGTSMAQLTQAMGITAPSLYAAFGSKQALYEASVQRYLAVHANFITKSLNLPGPARQLVAGMLQDAAETFTQPELPSGCLIGSGSLQCSDENQTIASNMSGLRQHAQGLIETRLKQAIDDGELPPGTDAKVLAGFYSTTVQGMSVQAIDGASRSDLKAIAETAMEAWPDRSG